MSSLFQNAYYLAINFNAILYGPYLSRNTSIRMHDHVLTMPVWQAWNSCCTG